MLEEMLNIMCCDSCYGNNAFSPYSKAISYENLWKVLVSEDFADIFWVQILLLFPQDMCICCTKHDQPLAVCERER